MRRRDILQVPTLLALAGCMGSPSEPPPTAPLLAPGLLLRLPDPQALGRNLRAYQLVRLQHAGQDHAFEIHILLQQGTFTVLIVDALGRRALRLTWQADGVRAETAPWLPAQLRPGSMLADIFVLYWPPPVVASALATSGTTLITAPHQRRLLHDGQAMAEADYDFDPASGWNGKVRYANRAWGYSLDIHSSEPNL